MLCAAALFGTGLLVAGARPHEVATTSPPASPAAKLRGVLLTAQQASVQRLRQIKADRGNAVVLNLTEREGAAATRAAVRRIRAAGLAPYYWIEVGRCPALADAHPEWMASLQGHPEWRRHFPGAPQPAAGEVVKNYPWVPILSREGFAAQQRRVAALLRDRPRPLGIFLNDLQAAPSACGCGNLLCRWVMDYGPIRTTSPLPADAAARFIAAVQKLAPRVEVIAVWTTECEEHQMAKEGDCAGVPCFSGACWHASTEQLMPLARRCPRLAALLPYRAFGRDQSRYGPTAGWVTHALRSFQTMPPQRGGEPVPARRLIAVLQGWGVTPAERHAQIRRAEEAGAAGTILSVMKIEQGWEPRLHKVLPDPPAGP
jgi:hypothetical protein